MNSGNAGVLVMGFTNHFGEDTLWDALKNSLSIG
jgi:hypothetical protein